MRQCSNPGCTNPPRRYKDLRDGQLVWRLCCSDECVKQRQRQPYGATLTETDVRAIRRSTVRTGDLAASYGVSRTTIQRTRSGSRWGWVV